MLKISILFAFELKQTGNVPRTLKKARLDLISENERLLISVKIGIRNFLFDDTKDHLIDVFKFPDQSFYSNYIK